jgi:predicted O-methyltransferase YrrM
MSPAAVVTYDYKLDISRALPLPGWMSEEELLWLAIIAHASPECVEIGSYAGRSARAIGDNLPANGHLTCIDPFSHTDPLLGQLAAEIEQSFLTNTSDLITQGRVRLLKSTSADAVSSFSDSSLDFVFIDGEHSYPNVFADIINWSPKVRPGGILAGHDYGVHPGVAKAVEDGFGRGGFGLPAGSVWCVRM